jgi:uncharacterized protein YndB with AHSA1/START domain
VSVFLQRAVRWLKGVVLFGAALATLLLVVALLIPGRWHVERSVVINAAPERVYPPVAELRQWRQWTIWYARNPQPETRYEGPASGVGAVSEWRDEHGSGRVTVTAAEPDRRIAYDLLFDGDMLTRGSIVLAPEAGGTRVTWTFEGDAGLNPVARYFGFMVMRAIADDFDHGLARLKRRCEDYAAGP